MFFVIVFGVGIAAGVIIAAGISYYKLVVLSEPTEDKTSTNSTTRPSPSGTSKSPEPNATEQKSAEIISPRQLELTIEPVPVIELRRTHERQEVPRENTRRDSDDTISKKKKKKRSSSSGQPSPRQSNPAVDPIISPRRTEEMYIIPSTSINVRKSLDQGTLVENSESSTQSSFQETEHEDV